MDIIIAGVKHDNFTKKTNQTTEINIAFFSVHTLK